MINVTCEKMRDLILTDYLDGELDELVRQNVERHLRDCTNCRGLAEDVKKKLVLPLTQTIDKEVPERVWLSIKEKIEEANVLDQSKLNSAESIFDFFNPAKLMPIALGFIFVTIVSVGIIHDRNVKQAEQKHQMEYLAFVLESVSSDADVQEEKTTALEEYFL